MESRICTAQPCGSGRVGKTMAVRITAGEEFSNARGHRPARSPDEAVCRQATATIRSLADLVVPGHDPLTFDRWPAGIIGGKPSN